MLLYRKIYKRNRYHLLPGMISEVTYLGFESDLVMGQKCVSYASKVRHFHLVSKALLKLRIEII